MTFKTYPLPVRQLYDVEGHEYEGNIMEQNTWYLMPNDSGISETETSTRCLAAKDVKKKNHPLISA